MTVRVGVQLHPQHASYAQMRDAWLRVEEMGADTIFTWDHFYPLYGDRDGKHFECWTFLGAMAEVTERVEFGRSSRATPTGTRTCSQIWRARSTMYRADAS